MEIMSDYNHDLWGSFNEGALMCVDLGKTWNSVYSRGGGTVGQRMRYERK